MVNSRLKLGHSLTTVSRHGRPKQSEGENINGSSASVSLSLQGQNNRTADFSPLNGTTHQRQSLEIKQKLLVANTGSCRAKLVHFLPGILGPRPVDIQTTSAPIFHLDTHMHDPNGNFIPRVLPSECRTCGQSIVAVPISRVSFTRNNPTAPHQKYKIHTHLDMGYPHYYR